MSDRLTEEELERVIKHVRYGVNVSSELRRLVAEVRRARRNECSIQNRSNSSDKNGGEGSGPLDD